MSQGEFAISSPTSGTCIWEGQTFALIMEADEMNCYSTKLRRALFVCVQVGDDPDQKEGLQLQNQAAFSIPSFCSGSH